MFELKRKKVLQASTNSITPKTIKKEGDGYLPIRKHIIQINDTISFNIYFSAEPEEISLLLKNGTTISPEDKQKIKSLKQLYVSENGKSEYDSFLEKHLATVLKNSSLTIDEKTDLIYQSGSELTQSLLKNPTAPGNLKRAEKIVSPILHSIIQHEDTIASFIKIIEYDYYTHTHSLNVSIYSLSLAAELNFNEKDLTSLGRAALLHDIGKSEIEHNIVNKKGKLTIGEYKTMESHPELGHKIALNMGVTDSDILDGIRHHHEKLDGMGYPDNLKEDEITLFPRIICICDIFDALTTRRSYKDAMSAFDALYLMKKEKNKKVDIDILNSFVKMLHN